MTTTTTPDFGHTDTGGKKPWYIRFLPLIAIGGVAAIIAITLFAVNNGVTNKGNVKQTALNAQYEKNINYLSDCIVRIREAAGITQGQTEALDQIITNAVKGRYEEGSSAQVGGGQLFSAITEAYPDLSGLSASFDRVLTIATGCRFDYRDEQTSLQSRIADFDSWRLGSWVARTFGGEYPTDNLIARKGDDVLTGDQALVQMRNVVVVGDASKAYETGELKAEDPFGARNGQN
jgi:hypothetical protein